MISKIRDRRIFFPAAIPFSRSFSRGYNNNWLYNRIFRLSWVHEFGNHVSYILGTEYWKQQPAGSLAFVKNPVHPNMIRFLKLRPEIFQLAFRWAPNEQFFESKAARRNIINKYPVISFQYSKGIKGLYGGEYNFDAYRIQSE